MTKRILSITLAMCLVLSLGTIGANANESGSVYNKTTGMSYDTLAEAISYASSGDTIYFTADYALESSVSIPNGVTVVVPSSSLLNDTETGNNASGGVTSGSAYVTLTIPAGVNLTVNGTLLVAGNQQSTQPKTGCLTGNYGAISLGGNILVNSGAALYARGKIDGTGGVVAYSGSSIYQLFQIHDWRGGTKTQRAYNAGVFPFNCYEISNIKARVVYMYGCNLFAQYYIYAGGLGNTGNIRVIGTNGLLQLSSNGQYIITTYNASTNRLTATINGIATTNDVGITYSLFIFSYSFTSQNKELPFGYSMDVVIPSGSALYITNSIKLLPGCTFTNNGTLSVTGNLYVYGTNYSSTYNFANWTSSTPATVSGTVSGSGGVYSSVGSGTPSTTIKEYIQSSGAVTVNFY